MDNVNGLVSIGKCTVPSACIGECLLLGSFTVHWQVHLTSGWSPDVLLNLCWLAWERRPKCEGRDVEWRGRNEKKRKKENEKKIFGGGGVWRDRVLGCPSAYQSLRPPPFQISWWLNWKYKFQYENRATPSFHHSKQKHFFPDLVIQTPSEYGPPMFFSTCILRKLKHDNADPLLPVLSTFAFKGLRWLFLAELHNRTDSILSL